MAFFGVCGWYMGGVFSCFFVFFRKNANFAHLCTPRKSGPPPPISAPPRIKGGFPTCNFGTPRNPKMCKNVQICTKFANFPQKLQKTPKSRKMRFFTQNADFLGPTHKNPPPLYLPKYITHGGTLNAISVKYQPHPGEK